MNIYDISEKAGVSIATVSRVINGNSKVSDKTRQQVLHVMEECGYTPNVFARGLGLNTMRIVGILCADSSDPYVARAIFYLEQELRNNNYDALLCCTGYELEEKQKYMQLLLSKRTDAIILVGSNFVELEDKKNQYLLDASKKVPLMIVNGALSGTNIYCSLCDDRHATYEATKALQESGCQNILYLYNAKSYSGNEKLTGYLEARKEVIAGPLIESEHAQFLQGSIVEIKDRLHSLAKQGLHFDAILTADDHLAVGALKYAKEANLVIPKDFSIVGYNNSIIAQCCEPELTSIDNKLEAVCKTCIKTLMKVFAGEELPHKTVFSAELMKRGTTQI